MSGQTERCAECGAALKNGGACIDHFHLILGWELTEQLYDVHHLAVLSYFLQHPALYSPEGLPSAIGQLVDFVEHGVTPQQMRQRIAAAVDSGTRSYRIAGTPAHHGAYAHVVTWQVRVDDVVRAGVERYYASVQRWAASILDSLRQSGNL
ncbi:MAG: DUF5946 family protein [bacterium]|nr:DUF5946 family protein [bacterium]